MKHVKRRLHSRVVIAAILLIAVVATSYYIGQKQNAETKAASKTPAVIGPPATPPGVTPQTNSFDRSLYSLTEPTSFWVVVNKQRPLQPATYVPAGLIVPTVTLRSNIPANESQIRPDVAAALKTMFEAALAEGVSLNMQSGYRSYNYQTNLYSYFVQKQGQAVADTQSARPGHSEHQTGLAVDVGGVTKPACNVEACFATTPEGQWAASHAHKYGFIIRYPSGYDSTTGYTYEPWHLRYVGPELAAKMRADAVMTLEDFFGLPTAPTYN